jgi:NAD(P)-dependent dehydrogenase (short-subunit alcohol dehydrogenase family)
MKEKSGGYSNAFTATLTGIADLFRKQKNVVVLDDEVTLNGKNVLVNGASSGLGFEAAMQLAGKGANVWMVCRSGIPQKGELIRERTGNPNVRMLYADLSDIDSIRHLVDQLLSASVKLDILIENAAVVPAKSRKTKQGIEEMFMVNYLSKYLLMRWLLDEELLNTANGAVPRIIYVSSESHRNPKGFDWDNFGMYKEYSMGKTVELYGYYKLLMTTFVNALSQRLNPGGELKYSVFALCPGPVNSNIAREAPVVFKPLLKLVFGIFFRSPVKAVKPVIYFATSADVKEKSIDYLFLLSRKEMDPKSVDEANGKKLWMHSGLLLEKHGIVFRKELPQTEA